MATGLEHVSEPGARGDDVHYFMGGVPLVKPLKSHDIQPPLEEWGWEPPAEPGAEPCSSSLHVSRWHPRITFTGLSDEEKEEFSNAFSLFDESPDGENSAGMMRISNVKTLFRSLGRVDAVKNAECEKLCETFSSDSADGSTILTREAFLRAMTAIRKREEVALAQEARS